MNNASFTLSETERDIYNNLSQISEELSERFRKKRLTLDDVINNIQLFENIPIEKYMGYSNFFEKMTEVLGSLSVKKIIIEHSDVIRHLLDDSYFGRRDNFIDYLYETRDFIKTVNKYFFNDIYYDRLSYSQYERDNFKLPDWIASMHFKVLWNIDTVEDLLKIDDDVLIFNKVQRRTVDLLGIENIKKLDQETGFFSHKFDMNDTESPMFKNVGGFITNYYKMVTSKNDIDFKNGTLSYQEFRQEFAKMLDLMRHKGIFSFVKGHSYDFINGTFRDDFKEIFMDKQAPEYLRTAFYLNNINPEFIANNRDYIHYLLDKNLAHTIHSKMSLVMPVDLANHSVSVGTVDFIFEYAKRYGNLKLLTLISKYGSILNNIEIDNFHNEIEDEHLIEKNLRNAIYKKITTDDIFYWHLVFDSEFVSEYPQIFITNEELDSLSIPLEREKQFLEDFYHRKLTFGDIRNNPQIVNILKDKDLFLAFGGNKAGGLYDKEKRQFLELLQVFGNEKFLNLCVKYGNYMNLLLISKHIKLIGNKFYQVSSEKKELTIDDISEMIEDAIYREIALGRIVYDENAPEFLHQKYPNLFIDENVPKEVKDFFYNKTLDYDNPFEALSKHKEWLPYFKDKAIETVLLRHTWYYKSTLIYYFRVFGKERGLNLGINRAETVYAMMEMNEFGIDTMKKWYDKTGGKFIPDVVIMKNIPYEDADKFLTSATNWSHLMKIKGYAQSMESREAMLKLAYSFGAFDGDKRGYNKAYDLLTDIPKHISDSSILYDIDRIIHWTYFSENNAKDLSQLKLLKEQIKDDFYSVRFSTIRLLEKTIKEEKLPIDIRENGLKEIYRENDDGSFTLVIDKQRAPKTYKVLYDILSNYQTLPMLTPDKAHKLFGGFELKYDPYFREFLLANMDEILKSSNYVTYLGNIQRQFSDIRTANSNRALTLDLAISYVMNNKYTNVNVGNEGVSEISAIAGYSQEDFNTLQQIYNHGKQRTFSSIPRIQGSNSKYTYEMLKLDDPLAMAIGTLSDCCQELGNAAEVCMEHSMTSQDGRIFVIRDIDGNIVSQSWVWRNKDVMCFDNIEIPDKAFARAKRQNGENTRSDFTDEVYNVYKAAADELIMADEKVYRSLLDSGKITKEQYDGLRLGKITVGLGYNDIAESIKKNAKKDNGELSRPLKYVAPVELFNGLYTNDSTTQYILSERDDRRKYSGSTLPIHHDEYTVYDDNNFDQKQLLRLEKLEIVTKGDNDDLVTDVEDYSEENHYIKEIAYNCDLDEKTTKIVMNPNFAIIYDEDNDKVRIGKLLFNTKVDNEEQQIDIIDKVVIQIRLAIEQIKGNKQIDISELDDKQKEMYEKAMNLTNELDIERGLGHAR